MTSKINPKWKAAFLARCPACGKPGAFQNIIKIADHCKSCGVELKNYETADGPAFFAISIIGTLVGFAAGIIEVIYSPPLWVHLALWIPITFVGSIIVIRITKTLMIAHQMDLKNRKSYKG